jgi:hypothetical protein
MPRDLQIHGGLEKPVRSWHEVIARRGPGLCAQAGLFVSGGVLATEDLTTTIQDEPLFHVNLFSSES